MSAVRTITFNATVSGVTPTGPQDAGVQGDHNATQVVWSLDAALINPDYRYRCEFVDGAGGWDTTQYLTPSADKTIVVSLPRAWTAAGGCGVIRLCVSEFLDGAEERSLYTLTGRLQFAGRENGGACAAAYETKLPVLIEEVTEAMDGAADAAAQANTAAAGANAAAAAANEAAASADAVADQVQQKLDRGEFIGPRGPVGPQGDVGPQGPQGVSGVYVGEGEMPAGYNVQIDPSGEADVCITKAEADSRYAGALTESASGIIAALTEAAAAPLRRLAVRGKTIETGTGDKGPDNPYAVDGITPAKATACGRNLLPKMTIASGTYHSLTVTNNPDGSVTLNGTPTNANVWYAGSYNLPTVFFRLPAGIYTAAPGIWLFVTSSTDSYQGTFELSEPTNFCGVRYRGKTGHSNLDTYNNETIYPQVVMGQTLPDYEPYTGITVALPEISPLYGNGMINDEYDAATGMMTRRWKRMELNGTENWLTRTSGADVYGYQLPNFFDAAGADGICSHFEYLKNAATGATNTVCVASSSTYTTLCIYIDTISTVDGLKSWLAAQKAAGTPVTVVYQLATPEATRYDPVQVVPFAPVSNIFTDAGEIDAEYCLDTRLALEKRERETDDRYAGTLTGSASGAMAHMTDVSGIGSLRRLAVLGETAEAGTGDKGPDHPYAVDGVVPAAVSAAGKNLIGLESPCQIASSVEGIGSATVERYNNGVTLTMSSASSATWAAERLWWPITAGTYTLRVKMETNDSAFTPTLGVYLKKTLTDTAAALTTVTASGSKTITVGASGYIGLYLHLTMDTGNTGARTVRYYDIQLEPGNTVTDYEPYTGATVTLPTLEPLYGDGTINDEYDAATGIETRRWKRMELDGTENWQTLATQDNSKWRNVLPVQGVYMPENSSTLPDLVCTHYLVDTSGNNWRCIQSATIDASNADRLSIYDNQYNAKDPAAWKTYLAAQKAAGTPVTVVYQLAEPVVTQRDPARVIPPAPVCNVYADQGDVDVTYNRDINMAFAALETAMKTLLGGA